MLRYGEEQTGEVEDYNKEDEYGEANQGGDVIEVCGLASNVSNDVERVS